MTSPSPVYKVKVVATEETPSHDNYIMSILTVIKMGTSNPGGRGHGHLGGRGSVTQGWGHPGGLGTPKGPWGTPMRFGVTQVGWGHPRVLGDTNEVWCHPVGLGTPKGAQ